MGPLCIEFSNEAANKVPGLFVLRVEQVVFGFFFFLYRDYRLGCCLSILLNLCHRYLRYLSV